jgi:branched-chain amino acid transport system substrate-binding protein
MKRTVRHASTAALLLVTTIAVGCTSSGSDPIVVGALYPTSGTQGPGGIDEHRGVLLAAELTNADGGIEGRAIEIRSIDVPASDAAPGAVDRLAADGIDLVLGSYGSTISAAASVRTAEHGMLFWETGAVGMLPAGSGHGRLTFRVPPTGGTLGAHAIAFVAGELAKTLGRRPQDLRFAIAFVDDVYGRSVAEGAERAIRAEGLRSVGRFGYDFRTQDYDTLARRIEAARPDVLFVSAYLDDGIALREALVRQRVPLVASIGTSSSYCMPEFGNALGPDAVGLFASDKPAAGALDPEGLRPAARALLSRANDAYRARWGEEMSPPALAGFSAAWALFDHVMPAARDVTPQAVATAARSIDLPAGSLPNGSGLRFGSPGSPGAGDNLAAASVIWEWVAPGEAAVVWPPAFATRPVEPLSIDPWTTT